MVDGWNKVFINFLFILSSLGLSSCSSQEKSQSLQWNYQIIDSIRGSNDLVKEWGWFGMDFKDGNKDGLGDILAGKWFYLNQNSISSQPWKRVVVADSMDGMFIFDVDNDQFTDVIGLKCNQQIWYEATDSTHETWRPIVIGNEAICSHHMTSMGFHVGDIFSGGKEELIFTDKPGRIIIFEVSENPEEPWHTLTITNEGTIKFVSTADINQDGKNDIISGFKPDTGTYYNGLCWFEQPDNQTTPWVKHILGYTQYSIDHIVAADLNDDNKTEIIVSEGRVKTSYPASVYIFHLEENQTNFPKWMIDTLVTQSSTNSLEAGDMDNDGDIDIVAGEHKGDLSLQLWRNEGDLKFIPELIDQGKESHNGAKLFDVDNDGDLDIASTGWFEYKNIHLWINKSIQ